MPPLLCKVTPPFGDPEFHARCKVAVTQFI